MCIGRNKAKASRSKKQNKKSNKSNRKHATTAPNPTSSMKQIDSLDDFKTELKNAGGKLVLVDFYATWCGPCKQIAPKLEKFESTYTEVVFLKVDVDEAEDITKEYTITAMPTFKFFKNEKEVDEVVGASDTSIEAVLNKLK